MLFTSLIFGLYNETDEHIEFSDFLWVLLSNLMEREINSLLSHAFQLFTLLVLSCYHSLIMYPFPQQPSLTACKLSLEYSLDLDVDICLYWWLSIFVLGIHCLKIPDKFKTIALGCAVRGQNSSVRCKTLGNVSFCLGHQSGCGRDPVI